MAQSLSDVTIKIKRHTVDTPRKIITRNLICLCPLYSITETHTCAKAELPCQYGGKCWFDNSLTVMWHLPHWGKSNEKATIYIMYTGLVSLPFLQLVQFSLRKDPQQSIYHVQVPCFLSFCFVLPGILRLGTNCESSCILDIKRFIICEIKWMQDEHKDETTRTWSKVCYPIEVTTKVQNEQTV